MRSRTLKMQSSSEARPSTTSSAKARQEGAPQEPQWRPGRWDSNSWIRNCLLMAISRS